MDLHKYSSTLPALFLLTLSLSADPVMVAQWQWTDPAGTLHEYNAYSFSCRSWEMSNDEVIGAWHLATITSTEEQTALIAGMCEVGGEYWLGGCQANRGAGAADNWAWVTGEEWNYKNWAPGEPNDAYGSNSEQHAAIWSKWGATEWLWNDEGYLPNVKGYIAERTQPVPEPGQLPLFAAGLLGIMFLARKRVV
jgi:hypothetical protein